MINVISIFLTYEFQKKNMWCSGLNLLVNQKVQGSIPYPIVFSNEWYEWKNT
jgi:hypothetical protein